VLALARSITVYLTLTSILTPAMTFNLIINIINGFFWFKLCGKVVLLAVLVQIVSELYFPLLVNISHKLCKLGWLKMALTIFGIKYMDNVYIYIYLNQLIMHCVNIIALHIYLLCILHI